MKKEKRLLRFGESGHFRVSKKLFDTLFDEGLASQSFIAAEMIFLL